MKREIIIADKAPAAIGPYSVGVRTGDLVFTAGQVGLDRGTDELVPGGIEAQTRQVMFNLQNVLQAAGSDLRRVVKTTVFLQNMGDFAAFNKVYGEYFPDDPPARSTVAVAALPKGALVEIEAVAITMFSRGD
ncbi:MAG: RidA family protein [Chloroflexi bacterium]|nr:RidA family protein [Chloroflexota bacterium]